MQDLRVNVAPAILQRGDRDEAREGALRKLNVASAGEKAIYAWMSGVPRVACRGHEGPH